MAIRFSIYLGLAVGNDASPATCKASRDLAIGSADRHLHSYSCQDIQGRWNGIAEPTLLITLITDRRTDITKVNALAHEYKHSNQQEAVMIVEEEVDIRFY